MPKPFDVTTKQLVELNPGDWLHYLHLPGETVEVMDADLATISTEADRVLRVLRSRPYLIHIEFQSSHDGTLINRTLRYNVLLDTEYSLPVTSVLVLLRPEAASSDMTGTLRRADVTGQEYLTFEYQIVRLWEQPVEEALGGGLATLPLAPLSRVTPEALPGVVSRMEARIDAEAAPDEAKMLWASTYILLGLKFSAAFAAQLLKGVQQMKESATYQAILAEGREQGREQGKELGLEQGLEQGARATILRLGAKRFGPLPADIEKRLADIHSFERLETLAERLLEVESWAELLGSDA